MISSFQSLLDAPTSEYESFEKNSHNGNVNNSNKFAGPDYFHVKPLFQYSKERAHNCNYSSTYSKHTDLDVEALTNVSLTVAIDNNCTNMSVPCENIHNNNGNACFGISDSSSYRRVSSPASNFSSLTTLESDTQGISRPSGKNSDNNSCKKFAATSSSAQKNNKFEFINLSEESSETLTLSPKRSKQFDNMISSGRGNFSDFSSPQHASRYSDHEKNNERIMSFSRQTNNTSITQSPSGFISNPLLCDSPCLTTTRRTKTVSNSSMNNSSIGSTSIVSSFSTLKSTQRSHTQGFSPTQLNLSGPTNTNFSFESSFGRLSHSIFDARNSIESNNTCYSSNNNNNNNSALTATQFITGNNACNPGGANSSSGNPLSSTFSRIGSASLNISGNKESFPSIVCRSSFSTASTENSRLCESSINNKLIDKSESFCFQNEIFERSTTMSPRNITTPNINTAANNITATTNSSLADLHTSSMMSISNLSTTWGSAPTKQQEKDMLSSSFEVIEANGAIDQKKYNVMPSRRGQLNVDDLLYFLRLSDTFSQEKAADALSIEAFNNNGIDADGNTVSSNKSNNDNNNSHQYVKINGIVYRLILIDCRSPKEYISEHIVGAIHRPYISELIKDYIDKYGEIISNFNIQNNSEDCKRAVAQKQAACKSLINQKAILIFYGSNANDPRSYTLVESFNSLQQRIQTIISQKLNYGPIYTNTFQCAFGYAEFLQALKTIDNDVSKYIDTGVDKRKRSQFNFYSHSTGYDFQQDIFQKEIKLVKEKYTAEILSRLSKQELWSCIGGDLHYTARENSALQIREQNVSSKNRIKSNKNYRDHMF